MKVVDFATKRLPLRPEVEEAIDRIREFNPESVLFVAIKSGEVDTWHSGFDDSFSVVGKLMALVREVQDTSTSPQPEEPTE